MPFSETVTEINGEKISISGEEWDHFYERWIKRAIETYPSAKIECSRSTATPGNFVKGIVNNLMESDLVIADLTGQKGNVFYELGIRNALKTGTIIIAQSLNSIPSDLASYYCFVYNYTGKSFNYEKLYGPFEKQLHELIDSISKNKNYPDSPVSDFIVNREPASTPFKTEEIETQNFNQDEFFFLRVNNGNFSKIYAKDVLYIEADRSYSMVCDINGKHVVSTSLSVLLQKLNLESLVQVSRSHVVNINKIDSFKGDSVIIAKAEIRITAQFRSEFLRRIKFL